MSKRFTDTAIWEKRWFRELSVTEKTVWFYLKDRCDSVGVWEGDRETAEFLIGEPVDWEGFRQRCNENIVEMDNGKWWLQDFCDFQYGELVETCKPHVSYIRALEKHGLLKGYRKGLETLQEKEKEKELEKEKNKRGKHPRFEVPINVTRFNTLVADFGKAAVDQAMQERIDWENTKGKPKAKDYAAAAANWLKKAGVAKLPGRVVDATLHMLLHPPACSCGGERRTADDTALCMGCGRCWKLVDGNWIEEATDD